MRHAILNRTFQQDRRCRIDFLKSLESTQTWVQLSLISSVFCCPMIRFQLYFDCISHFRFVRKFFQRESSGNPATLTEVQPLKRQSNASAVTSWNIRFWIVSSDILRFARACFVFSFWFVAWPPVLIPPSVPLQSPTLPQPLS
jgi:hypothetical protein